ncbi:MAG: hypothetical protein M1819_001626 [Sarea resinae]|nr:MAG: hypothetical protein M1819_001626 [Sarea resinae]
MSISDAERTPSKGQSSRTTTIIVGAGYSGICAAIDLLRRNKDHDFVILEKSNQVGGTWNDNRYPGCSCDVVCHLYSLSFEPNPDWTHEYASQKEMQEYLISVAEKWDLYRYIRFDTTVRGAHWNEEDNVWDLDVTVDGGKAAEYGDKYSMRSDYLVSAVGQLNQPHYPDIEGLHTFQGKMMHSARWDWNVPLEGKRVAIVGNAASAVQIVPELAKVCKSLTVFHRTPNWVVPRGDKPISPTMRAIYRYVPWVRKNYRASLMEAKESFFDAAVVEDSPFNVMIKGISAAMMTAQLKNKPELIEKLTPNYPPGCKRILSSDDYYPALDLPHVHLEFSSIQRITPTGVEVDSKEYEFDVIVLATGFRTVDFMHPMKVTGLGGRSIEDIWEGGAKAYLGVTVESLPNFGMLYGPNTNLGHNSVILMIEAQSRFIGAMVQAVAQARTRGRTLSITPSRKTVEEYNSEIQARLNASTFAHENCQSWYKNADGVVTNNWCGNVVEYQNRLSVVNWADYDLSGTDAKDRRAVKPSYLGRVVEETQTSLWKWFGTAAIVTTIGTWCLLSQKSPGALLRSFKRW